MLQHTFLHLPGIAEHTERIIWDSGCRSWMEFMGVSAIPGMSSSRVGNIRSGVLESIQRFERCDWSFFDRGLPGRHKWRAFGDLRNDVLYVDIETDGGIGPNSITVIGTFDGKQTRLFVKDRDLQEAGAYIASFPLVVTFNGASFDMPIIRSRFPAEPFNHVHIDLLYPLRRLGYSGGLKQVEKDLGLARSGETRGLDGWDAVRLWREYRSGSHESLELLLRYNEEDILHLAPLMELVYGSLEGQLRSP